jgi:hypothetical protein
MLAGETTRWQTPVVASWAMLLPLGPLAIAALVLQLLGPVPEAGPLTEPAVIRAATVPLSTGPLIYATAVVIHVVLSLLAISSYALIIHDTDRPTDRKVAASCLAAAITVLVLAAFVALADPGIAAYRVTYFDYLQFYAAVPDAYFDGAYLGLPHVAWAILVPTALGVVAVMGAAAAADLLSTGLPDPEDPDATRKLRTSRAGVRRVLYLLSIVLVTSTLAASVFFHLPTGLYGAEEEVPARLSHYADTLSVFWGAVYTLTLITTVAVPAARLQRRTEAAGGVLAEPGREAEGKETEAEEGIADTLLGQVRLLLALLAPLIAGPVANILQAV